MFSFDHEVKKAYLENPSGTVLFRYRLPQRSVLFHTLLSITSRFSSCNLVGTLCDSSYQVCYPISESVAGEIIS